MTEYSANTGTRLPDAQPLSEINGFSHLPLAQITASLTNPRTVFTPDKLQELADSIKAAGVHQPILVRPLPGSRVPETDRRVRYEIVAGERRFRACALAGMDTIPAMIRTMSDAAVLESQLVENLHRDDLTALEEAEGYDRLMRHSALAADAVGAKISKSRSYVYARLKLLDLCLECKTALRDGAIDSSRALLIARVPDHKLQMKALAFATEKSGGSDVPSVRALQIWLQQNVMLPLERAPFQITDGRLVEAAGSCKECPKRTGANPDIFADVSGADICTDPPCYNAKAETHTARLLAKAEAKGMRLVSSTEAKAVCYEKSSTLKGYTPLSQVREDAGGERLDTLLGKDFEGAVLIENPWTHELIEAVPTAEAEGVLLARGLVKAVTKQKPEASKVEQEIERLKKSTERNIEQTFREEAYAAIAAAVRNTPTGADTSRLITHKLLRAWLIKVVEEMPAEHMASILQMPTKEGQTESQIEDTVRLRLQASGSATLFQAAALHMISDERTLPYPLQADNPTPLFSAIAADLGVDLPALRATVTKNVKASVSAEIEALKAQLKPSKPPAPTAPLAPASGLPLADAHLPKAAPLRKPRLSAQEAQSGIAEAMQGIEAGQVPCPDAPDGEPAQGPQAGPQESSQAPLQGTLAVGVIGIGARVKVLGNVSNRYSKWIGKTGTVTRQTGPEAFDVTFRGRTGGLAGFHASELEWVA